MAVTVLIVDDSKLARMSLAKLLSGLRPDWKRVEAANADEAKSVLRQDPPNLILLDFNMPGQDGLALAADIRASHPKLPIAVISANMQQEVVARARDAGASFLPKPLTEQSLKDYLTTLDDPLSGGS